MHARTHNKMFLLKGRSFFLIHLFFRAKSKHTRTRDPMCVGIYLFDRYFLLIRLTDTY